MKKKIKQMIRKMFCKNELKKGEMLILWKDIDNEVSGWNCKADKTDAALYAIGSLVSKKKIEKLEQITGIRKKNVKEMLDKILEEEEYLEDTPPPDDL